MALTLVRHSQIPLERYKVAVLSWSVRRDNTYSVLVKRCFQLPTITDNEIIGDIKTTTPADFVDDFPTPEIAEKKYGIWSKEYRANRYLRFESRSELNQRYQDILTNLLVLHESGRVDLSASEIWHSLFQHTFDELCLRDEYPHPGNLDPSVKVVRPFDDEEICKRATLAVAETTVDNDILVKYGRPDDMENLYKHGLVWINPASSYDNPEYNQAIRDKERKLTFKGGFVMKEHPKRFVTKDFPSNYLQDISELDFVRMFDAPILTENAVANFDVEMKTDYWSYCMSGKLLPRLFSDFDKTACVLIKREPFIERLRAKIKEKKPETSFCAGFIDYQDPLGAYAKRRINISSIPVYMTKWFRYAYQEEFRLVWIPHPFQENLNPMELEIGSLEDIAKLLIL